jgi:hypothetical protein
MLYNFQIMIYCGCRIAKYSANFGRQKMSALWMVSCPVQDGIPAADAIRRTSKTTSCALSAQLRLLD